MVVTVPKKMKWKAKICYRLAVAYAVLLTGLTLLHLCLHWGTSGVLTSSSEGAATCAATDESTADAESGGAEWLLVLLFHILHVIALVCLITGRTSATRLAIGCSTLMACALMYLLFCGCLKLQEHIERYSSVPGSNTSMQQQPYQYSREEPNYYDTGDAVAVAAVAAGAAVVATPAPSSPRTHVPGTCAAPSNAPLGAADIFWMVLETLVDVCASIFTSDNGVQGGSEAYRVYRDGRQVLGTPPFARLRRFDLLLLHVVGFAVSFAGVLLFDVSATAEAPPLRRDNPNLTMEALSKLGGKGAGRESKLKRASGNVQFEESTAKKQQ